MKRTSLNGTWQLRYGPHGPGMPCVPHDLEASEWPTLEATVPGNVELDLMRAGRLPELAVASNIYEALELEDHHWWYCRQFPTPEIAPGERVELVFEGLDCLAAVWINHELAAETANMLIPHRLDVTDLLMRHGTNSLVVHIRPAVREGRQPLDPLCSAQPTNYESLMVRKAPHMYGWDIMPRLVSAGLWRDVYLETNRLPRFSWLYWATLATDPVARTARIRVDWEFAANTTNVDDWTVRVQLARNGAAVHDQVLPVFGLRGTAQIALSEAELWWPKGHDAGEQAALYDATIELVDAAGCVHDRQDCRIGLRTVELRRTDIASDADPGEFAFVVNGERIFIHGTNWVPLDALHSRDLSHLDAAVGMLVELNCNMVRCWGGNVYEADRFFELCDEAGVLVWQDFALACALYPQSDHFASVLRAEAEAVVARLRNHACLALWCGDNENDMFYRLRGLDPNRDRLSRGVLPEVVRRLDPHRAYLPSSPFHSPALLERQGQGDGRIEPPEQHLWGPRGDFKAAFYTESAAHFVSEIGYHGCPDRRSLEAFLDPGSLWPWQDNQQWLTHAVRPHPKATSYDYRIKLMAEQVTVLFDRIPDSLDDFVLASQIVQAEALKFFIEFFRLGKWRRSGILWWNLRDGWPIISDAVVDYHNRKKLAYEYVRRVQMDVCVAVGEADRATHPVVVVNDTRQAAGGRLEIRRAADGRLLLQGNFDVPANGKVTIGALPAADSPELWLLAWQANGGPGQAPTRRGRNHYLAGPRPFTLEQYRQWLEQLAIPPDVGPTVQKRTSSHLL